MENRKSIRRRIIAFLLFVSALCFTELSPFSRHAVSLTNGGFGVFDMTKYNADTFTQVMKSSNNMRIYWKYYIFDFVFTAVFFNFMIQMVSGFRGERINKVKLVSYVIAAIRGLLDMTENCIMLNQIYAFPNVNNKLINICSAITGVKFHFMRGWFVCFFILIIMQRRSRRKQQVQA